MVRLAAGLALILGAVFVLASGETTLQLAGVRPLGKLDPKALDEPFAVDDREAPQFLQERNQVELSVPRDMTVGELLRLYPIDFVHVRAEIAKQLGITPGALTDTTRLHKGQRLRLTLTPPQESSQ